MSLASPLILEMKCDEARYPEEPYIRNSGRAHGVDAAVSAWGELRLLFRLCEEFIVSYGGAEG